MTVHKVTPSILFGDASGSEPFYTPVAGNVHLFSITPSYRPSAPRIVSKYNSNWAHVSTVNPNAITNLSILLHVQELFQGSVQNLVWEIVSYIGPTNQYYPRDLWYFDDILEYVTSLNIETIGSNKTIEITGEVFFDVGDYLFYSAGTGGTSEIVVVESIASAGGSFVADLQKNHGAGALLYQPVWVYPKARLDSIVPQPSSTGRSKVEMLFTTEGQPLAGTTLPS